MRPLYVEGGAKVRLTLDGPSLVVERDGVAHQRFPLARLSRVVLCGRIEASYEALRACAAAGIPVAALAATGEPCGFLLPWRPRLAQVEDLLEEFLSRPDCQSRYEDWRMAEERRAILKALRAANLLPAPSLHPLSAWRTLLRTFDNPRAVEMLLETWRVLLAVSVTKALSAAGFFPRLATAQAPVFYLPSHLTSILSWAHWGLLRTLTVQGVSWKNRVAAYETIRSRDEQRTEALVQRFRTWLGGMPWR